MIMRCVFCLVVSGCHPNFRFIVLLREFAGNTRGVSPGSAATKRRDFAPDLLQIAKWVIVYTTFDSSGSNRGASVCIDRVGSLTANVLSDSL
jgi:hypothetical protein